MKKKIGSSGRFVSGLMACLLLLFAFFGWSKAVRLGYLRDFDFATTVKIQDRMPIIERINSDEVWEDIGFFVSPTVSALLVIFITLVVFLQKRGSKRLWSFVIPICFILLVAVEVYGKSVVESPAPPFFMLKNPTTIFPKYHVQELYSYPSGHAARATYLAFIAILALWPKLRTKRKRVTVGILLMVFVLMVSVGKIYLGHHWMSDVVGGWLIGFALSVLMISL